MVASKGVDFPSKDLLFSNTRLDYLPLAWKDQVTSPLISGASYIHG